MVITYETLFELLRLEKNRQDIQKLDHSFFNDVLSYLNQKKSDSLLITEQSTLFESTDRERAIREFENLKKILKDLYDRREKKVVNMALSKSRTGVNLINVQNLLPSEKSLFNSINNTLQDFRKNILFKIACGERPTGPNSQVFEEIKQKETTEPKEKEETQEDEETQEETKELKTDPILNENTENGKIVRFLDSIDEIIGPDLEVYGPFDKGATSSLPKELARVLIEKQQAEET